MRSGTGTPARSVLSVRRVEAHRQAEGLPRAVGRVAVDERHRLVAGDVGEVAVGALVVGQQKQDVGATHAIVGLTGP